MKHRVAVRVLIVTLVCVLTAGQAFAISPVGSTQFNVQAHINLSELTRGNFYQKVTPIAKTEQDLSWFGFDGLCESQVRAVREFTQATGIVTKHTCVEGDQGVQQLLAEHQAGKPSAADVFFGPNNSMRTLTQAGVIANLPLAGLLPNAVDVEKNAALASRGFNHGGTVVPWHRNQTALAYNSSIVQNPPDTFDALLEFARQNSGKLTVTDPTKGGSGGGFLESALLNFSPDCKQDYYNFDLTKEQAESVAQRCMSPVLAYWRQLKPYVRFSTSNSDSVIALGNNTALVATVWEDELYQEASKGLIPPTVRPILLKSGEVGDGDGIFIVSSTQKLEAALLLIDFLMSEKIQVEKLESIGSRTARQQLKTAGQIPPKLAQYLVPDAMYRERTRPRINGLISDAAADIFVREIIAK